VDIVVGKPDVIRNDCNIKIMTREKSIHTKFSQTPTHIKNLSLPNRSQKRRQSTSMYDANKKAKNIEI